MRGSKNTTVMQCAQFVGNKILKQILNYIATVTTCQALLGLIVNLNPCYLKPRTEFWGITWYSACIALLKLESIWFSACPLELCTLRTVMGEALNTHSAMFIMKLRYSRICRGLPHASTGPDQDPLSDPAWPRWPTAIQIHGALCEDNVSARGVSLLLLVSRPATSIFWVLLSPNRALSFYKGILPPILAETPKRATKFFCFEQYKQLSMTLLGTDTPSPAVSCFGNHQYRKHASKFTVSMLWSRAFSAHTLFQWESVDLSSLSCRFWPWLVLGLVWPKLWLWILLKWSRFACSQRDSITLR